MEYSVYTETSRNYHFHLMEQDSSGNGTVEENVLVNLVTVFYPQYITVRCVLSSMF